MVACSNNIHEEKRNICIFQPITSQNKVYNDHVSIATTSSKYTWKQSWQHYTTLLTRSDFKEILLSDDVSKANVSDRNDNTFFKLTAEDVQYPLT